MNDGFDTPRGPTSRFPVIRILQSEEGHWIAKRNDEILETFSTREEALSWHEQRQEVIKAKNREIQQQRESRRSSIAKSNTGSDRLPEKVETATPIPMKTVLGVQVPLDLVGRKGAYLSSYFDGTCDVLSKRGRLIARFPTQAAAQDWLTRFNEHNAAVRAKKKLSGKPLSPEQPNPKPVAPSAGSHENYLMPLSEKYGLPEIDMS